jgi:hypothetical protein
MGAKFHRDCPVAASYFNSTIDLLHSVGHPLEVAKSRVWPKVDISIASAGAHNMGDDNCVAESLTRQ